MNAKKIQMIGLVLVLAFFGMIVARAFMNKDRVVKNEDDFKATQQVLKQEWKLRHIGDTGLVLVTPEDLKYIPTKLDENALQTIDAYFAYEYSVDSFAVRINHIISKSDLDAKIYAEKLAKMIKQTKGVNKYSYDISPLEKGELKGSFLKGTASQYGLEIEIDSVVLVQGAKLWDVTVSFNSDNQKLRSLAEQILNSVEVK